ncbi:MAG: DUF3060 domain-containing protein [Myxococcota bacterium]
MSSMILWVLAQSASAGEAFVVDGAGGTLTHACAAGEAVTITGSMNKITLTGDCGALNLTGSNNEVHADGLSNVLVTGAVNKVWWARNLSGQKKLPVSITGIGNAVRRAE